MVADGDGMLKKEPETWKKERKLTDTEDITESLYFKSTILY